MANYATTFLSPNSYIFQIVNNLDLIMTLNKKKKN